MPGLFFQVRSSIKRNTESARLHLWPIFVERVFAAMMLEFRGALNLLATVNLILILRLSRSRKQTWFSGSCSGASLLLLCYFQVILNGSPALASLQMMPGR
jgi:hypothetical protein